MSKTKTKTKTKRGGGVLAGLSFDVRIRTDKLRAWLGNHPGETPPGLTSDQVRELLSE